MSNSKNRRRREEQEFARPELRLFRCSLYCGKHFSKCSETRSGTRSRDGDCWAAPAASPGWANTEITRNCGKHQNNHVPRPRRCGRPGWRWPRHGSCPLQHSWLHPELAAGPGELSHTRVLPGCLQGHGQHVSAPWGGAGVGCGSGALAGGRRCLALHFNAASILRDLPSAFPAHADTSSLNSRLASPQDTHG